MGTEPTTRRSIFAVWRWPRCVWFVIVPLMPVVYFLAAMPMLYVPVLLVVHFGAEPLNADWYMGVWQTVFTPAFTVAEHCQPLEYVMDCQKHCLDWLLGEEL